MAKLTENTLTLTGKSGTEYTFNIYSIDTEFKAIGGIYVFTKRYLDDGSYKHSKIYIGRTEDLSTRFKKHHKAKCINANNVNCVCVKSVPNERDRVNFETDLLLGNQTPCNEVNN